MSGKANKNKRAARVLRELNERMELPGGVLEEIRKVPGVLSARAISA